MSKLKVKFLRYKNAVIAEVLEQDESLREIGEIKSNGRYDIVSLYCPDIAGDGNRLYIRGKDISRDYRVECKRYVDEEKAKEAIKNFTEIINEINAEGEEDKTDEGFEVTIAG